MKFTKDQIIEIAETLSKEGYLNYWGIQEVLAEKYGDDGFKCQRCEKHTNDIRTVYHHATWYDMNKMDIPFGIKSISNFGDLYFLSVCKDCRADWLVNIKNWFRSSL